MATLTATFQELIEAQREEQWRRDEVDEEDIELSRACGMDAQDIGVFRRFSRRGLLFVVRCPKPTARAFHGMFPPKPLALKDKTGSSGLVVPEPWRPELQPGRARPPEPLVGQVMVSDYDLMSVWRLGPEGWDKLFISAGGGAARGPYSAEARTLLVQLNQQLVSRVQHGCQDDYQSSANPGLKPSDHFVAFRHGAAQYLSTPAVCQGFYAQNGLPWVYDAGGRYAGPVAG